ncbi:hypothetical protein [Kribbella pratensis]|uniref:Uncharacterized protein n=1 Tax=Kribbella pratensis TaxID=2512112 RepID=A0A4R8BWL9_9ACTN|nr:hypothetical protein [Kribbella pratensis]TDW66200.1 hypothetical protein EV653_6222 [Kribbella pratensis]
MKFTFRRARTTGIEALVQRNSDLPAFTELPPEFDLSLELKAAEAKARVDVESGAYDVTVVEAVDGQLPYEQEIDAKIDRIRSEEEVRRILAEAEGEHFVLHALESTEDEDGRKLSHTRLELQAAHLEADLAAAEASRAELGQILRGEKPAADDTDWSATEPPAPTSERYLGIVLRPERLKLWFKTVGLLIVFGVPEGYVLTWILGVFIHNDDDRWLGASLAAMLIVFMVMVPYVCGTRLVGCKRRGYANRLDRIVFLGTALWAVFGAGLALARTDASRQDFETQQLERAADGGGAPEQFHFWFAFVLWLVAILAVGIAMMFIKVLTHNPVRGDAVKADTTIALLRRRVGKVRTALTAVANHADFKRRMVAKQLEARKHMYDVVLVRAGTHVKRHYRDTLITMMGDPAFTTGVTSGEVA